MATVTFDTLKLTERLKAAGLPADQAAAIVSAIADAQDGLVSKEYLDAAFVRELAPLKADINLLKWMLSVLIAANFSVLIALLVKVFF